MRTSEWGELTAFVAVAEEQSFRKAAARLNLTTSTLSHALRALEERLGVRLLNRTTRSVSLTPDGAAYYERCTRIIHELEEIEASFQDAARRPQGRLRVDVSGPIGRRILFR